VEFDSDPHYADRRRQDEIMALEQALLTIPPCPGWCDGVETSYTCVEDDGLTFVRHHTRRLGAGVQLSQRERNRANVISVSPVVIDVEEREGLDAEAALHLASALLDAAGALSEIVAPEQTPTEQ
jgi:hypothetical protein